jgi:prepilin signal peptidase PulO-like enzyme (type II secretory pathway)
MLVELAFAVAITLLYWWEVGQQGLIPDLPDEIRRVQSLMPRDIFHLQFAGHVILLTFMLAASLIDIEEWIIPDAIAVTGTLVALVLAVAAPASHLVHLPVDVVGNKVVFEHLQLSSPSAPGAHLAAGRWESLFLGLGCVWLWAFALLPRVWTLRWGLGMAVKLFFRRLKRERGATVKAVLIGVVLTAVCAITWRYGEERWTALLSALVGLTVGAGIIWTIRIVSSSVLRREAMGFGDVTLMAMIGAFLGWQPTLVAFFISPFFGLFPAVVARLGRSRAPREVPYGPFLCAGTATVLLCWARIWPRLADYLEVFAQLGGGLVLLFILGLFALLALLLFAVQLAKKAFA